MKRRTFMKLIGAAVISPSLPKATKALTFQGCKIYYDMSLSASKSIVQWFYTDVDTGKIIKIKGPPYDLS